MQFKNKRYLSLLLTIIIVFTLVPPISVKAASSGFVTPTVTFRIQNDTLFLEGYGDVPDYLGTTNKIDLRPWAGQRFSKVDIGEGITYLGQYALAYHDELKWIDIPSTTFVANNTAFADDYDAYIHVKGDVIQYEHLGNTILYSSLQSIYAAGQLGRQTRFIFDDGKTAANFRCMTYPYVKYAYDWNEPGEPWRFNVTYFSEDAFTSICHDEKGYNHVDACKEPKSFSYMTGMSAFLDLSNYAYLQSYTFHYIENGGVANAAFSKPKRLVLHLDEDLQIPGVTYKLIQHANNGTVAILDDLDTNLSTFTFDTTSPSGTFILVLSF